MSLPKCPNCECDLVCGYCDDLAPRTYSAPPAPAERCPTCARPDTKGYVFVFAADRVVANPTPTYAEQEATRKAKAVRS